MPDVSANGVIVTGQADRLAAIGHAVTVVTGFPHYKHNPTKDPYRETLVRRDDDGAIRVYRTYLYVPQRKSRILD